MCFTFVAYNFIYSRLEHRKMTAVSKNSVSKPAKGIRNLYSLTHPTVKSVLLGSVCWRGKKNRKGEQRVFPVSDYMLG